MTLRCLAIIVIINIILLDTHEVLKDCHLKKRRNIQEKSVINIAYTPKVHL